MPTNAELEQMLTEYKEATDSVIASLMSRIGAVEQTAAALVADDKGNINYPSETVLVATEYKGRIRPAFVIGSDKNGEHFDLQVVMHEQGGRDVAALELLLNVPLSAVDFRS